MEGTMEGTVICGTLRNQDLIPAFLGALRKVCPVAYAQIVTLPFSFIPSWVEEGGESCDWWYSEEATEKCEILIDALNEHAPEGLYFGAHLFARQKI